MRPLCEREGCDKPCKYNGYRKDGSRKFYRWCSSCCKVRYNDTHSTESKPRNFNYWDDKDWVTPYGDYVKRKKCECCGFKAVHRIQLDVDHIDGNHSNNHPDNLQTLCANCHRLKTLLNKDHK